MNIYRNGEYNGFETSVEILYAIEKSGGDDILNDDSNSHRIWADPTAEEKKEVLQRAWKLADAETEKLFWGDPIVRGEAA